MNRLCITKLAVACRKAIAHNLLCIIRCRLAYLESITVSTNHIGHTIVPLSLRRVIFNYLHASPASGHMGKYKSLYRLKYRFFLPRMRTNIKDWLKQCPYYILTYKWRWWGQEVMFSCPVSSPFASLRADLWLSGHFIDRNGNTDLMNVMCSRCLSGICIE